MEEKIRIIGIIGLIIGILVAVAGIYYLGKEKNDPESKKIYGTITVIGVVVAIVMIIKIVLSM